MLPYLYQSESFTLYTYPMIFALAWSAGIQYIWYQLKDERRDFILFCIVSFISAWAGAKLVFLISIPSSLTGIINHYNFWSGGGFVFYGGLIAGLVVTLIWKKFRTNPFDMRLLVPAICLGHSIGRIGCFLTGCCFGRELDSGAHIPVALIESLFLFMAFIYFHKKRDGSLFELIKNYLVLYAIVRFGLEYLRADLVRGIFGRFSTSQWISLSLIIIYPVLNIFSSLNLKQK